MNNPGYAPRCRETQRPERRRIGQVEVQYVRPMLVDQTAQEPGKSGADRCVEESTPGRRSRHGDLDAVNRKRIPGRLEPQVGLMDQRRGFCSFRGGGGHKVSKEGLHTARMWRKVLANVQHRYGMI